MNKFLIVPFVAVSFVAAHAADSITGTISTPPLTLNLNSYQGFAYYGNTTVSLFTQVTGTPSTDLPNIATFSNLSLVKSGAIATSGPSPVTVTYTNGTTPPQSSATNSGTFYFDQASSDGTGDGFSLTTKLFAASETFQFLLQGYNSEFNLTAQLNDATTTTFSNSNVVLPGVWSGSTGINGSGNTYGLLTLTVNGAVGQTLTFSDVVAPNGGTFANAGIEAVTVMAVPEPSTYALMAVGVAILGVCFRRRRSLCA